jgi:hypothetical protein
LNLKNKILQIIKQVKVSFTNNDSSVYPKNQVDYNNKTSIVNRLSVYGYSYNPEKDTWGLSFSSQGNEAVKFVLFNEMEKRKKNLKPGEIVIHSPKTNSYIYLKENGSVCIDTSDKILLGSEDEGDLKKIVTEIFKDLFNNHVHPAPGGTTSPTTTPMTNSHLTETTKAK